MNKINQITGLICLISIIGWNSGSGKSNHEIINWKSEVGQLISPEDSLIQEKRPTYQELYSKSEQFYDAIGKLKHDPSTKIKNYIYRFNDKGDEVRIELFYINKRIVRIESRTFDRQDKQLGYYMFDFDEKNNCVSITKWGYEENMSYTYSMLWDSLIKFDVYNNIIDIGQDQRIEVIQSNKERLDSIMKHFPEFQYSMNWK